MREAVAQLAEQGVPTVTLISDLSNSRRVAYVGLDNRAAGRTAAYLIARFMGPLAHSRKAHVAMIVGSLRYRAHEEREAGFLHLFEEQFPLVQVVGVREGQDDAERNFLVTYIAEGILPKNPFQTLDRAGVGRLMNLAISSGPP